MATMLKQETSLQSMGSESLLKNVYIYPSNMKVMLVMFFDWKGFTLYKYIPHTQTKFLKRKLYKIIEKLYLWPILKNLNLWLLLESTNKRDSNKSKLLENKLL